jgi:hypothetical protein
MKYPETRRAAGWGFDFDWTKTESVIVANKTTDAPMEAAEAPACLTIEEKMRRQIDEHYVRLREAKEAGMMLSATQEKRKARDELVARRKARNALKGMGRGSG